MLRKIMLFVSSYVPLYILLIIKNIFERITDGGRFLDVRYKIKSAVWFDECNDWAALILLIISGISVIYLLTMLKRNPNLKSYKVVEVSDETGNCYFNYISIYLLSCMGLSLSNILDCVVLVCVMLIVGYIYISNSMEYMNPVAGILGYKVYNCTLDSQNTNDKDIRTVVFAPGNVKIKKGATIRASGKQGFIYISKKNKRTI